MISHSAQVRLILYGCGDLLNDYEGIEGQESYRGDLTRMYFVKIEHASGRLLGLEMTRLRVRGFRLHRAPAADVTWLAGMLDREGKAFGTSVGITPENRLRLWWRQ